MNLLMVTRRVDMDDDVVGYAHGLINCLAKKVAWLGVICLERGHVELPVKVQLFSMGKEKGYGRLREFMNYQRALAYLAPKADVIFGHMNPVYTILAAPWAKFLRRKLVMWYTHAHVSRQLKLAHLLVDRVVTATKTGFQLPSHKVSIIGHAIDTSLFRPEPKKKANNSIKLLSLGRFSPVKNIECMLKAMQILISDRNINKLTLDVVGGPGTPEHIEYSKMLHRMVSDLGLEKNVSFVGPVTYQNTIGFFRSADIFLHLTPYSLDKALLEAMACGCLPISCNQAYTNWVSDLGLDMLAVSNGNPRALAQKIVQLSEAKPIQRHAMQDKVRRLVVEKHDLEGFVERLCRVFEDA